MNPIESLIGRSPQYLYERDTPVSEATSLENRLSHASKVWLKDVLSARRNPWDVFGAYREDKSSETPWEHIFDGLEFAERLDTADRSSNGLREAIKVDARDQTKPSAWGTMVYEAFNNPRLSDHNHEHNRRLERWMEAMMQNIGALRHGETIYEWVDSAFLFGYWHDIDQLTTLQRNLDEEREPHGVGDKKELSPKKGHALAAAVMMLALHERYRKERLVRTRDAWDIAAGAAYMMMKHDEPEHFMEALAGRVPARRPGWNNKDILIRGSELQELFDSNELDMASISPSQMIELLRRIKKRYGFIGGNAMGIGLHPAFEAEYASELAGLLNNEEPLLKRLDAESRHSLDLATEAVVRADVIEMVAPPIESIFRTLTTGYSRKRNFMYSQADLHVLREDYNHLRVRHHLLPIELEGTDLFMDILENGEGNVENGDSDVRRMLWELLHIEKLSESSVIAKSPYIFKVNKDNAVMGLLAFRDIGSRIMTGDLSDVVHLYGRRMEEIGKKALKKAGYSGLSVAYLSLLSKRERDYMTYITDLCYRQGDTEGAKRFRNKAIELAHESNELITILSNKPDSVKGPHVYTPEEIDLFRSLCDRVLEKLVDVYKVTSRQLHRYKSKAARGKYPPTTPYGTYDSIASPESIRTYVKPLRVMEQTA